MVYRSTGWISKKTGLLVWQVRRMFEDKTFPDVPRLAGRRMIDEDMIPAIMAEARRRGWLPPALTPAQVEAVERGDVDEAGKSLANVGSESVAG